MVKMQQWGRKGKTRTYEQRGREREKRKLANFILLCENWQHSFIQVNFHWLLMRHWRESRASHSIQFESWRRPNLAKCWGLRVFRRKLYQCSFNYVHSARSLSLFMNVTIKSKFLCKFYRFYSFFGGWLQRRNVFSKISSFNTQYNALLQLEIQKDNLECVNY